MPSLKDLRNRIASVKSTRKITTAMKTVSAGKLRRAQEQALAGQPYAELMGELLGRLANTQNRGGEMPKLLSGTGLDQTHLLIVMGADRGLAGGFNANALREARRQIVALQAQGKTVKIITIGRKMRDGLRRQYAKLIVESIEEINKPRLNFAVADKLTEKVLGLFENHEFDVCSIVYNRFRSVIAQVPTTWQIVPFAVSQPASNDNVDAAPEQPQSPYEFEPDQETILEELLPRNLAVQIYRALLDNAAGEHAARMTAMDNATRNAGEMINKLTLNYNRARQASITTELIEIISGAEAL